MDGRWEPGSRDWLENSSHVLVRYGRVQGLEHMLWSLADLQPPTEPLHALVAASQNGDKSAQSSCTE